MSSIFKSTGMFRKFDGIIKNQLRRQLQSDKSKHCSNQKVWCYTQGAIAMK